jgi:arginyl-tRNA synthetase
VRDLAEALAADLGSHPVPEEAIAWCADRAKEMMIEEIRTDLKDFRVDFDSWKSEKQIHASGLLGAVMDEVRKTGGLYEQDGALWIRTSDFGDDKDRVIRKGDGQFTYFASDIAYHLEKRRRGFSRAINLWGADHHGYVPRVQAALAAEGIPRGWLTVLLLQLVKLWKGGQEVKMSKRAGHYVTLRELMEEVGVDAARFVFLSKHHDSALDFDVDLVKRQDSDNPVYYVQYAHARICSIFKKAEGVVDVDALRRGPAPPLEGLCLEEETALIRVMADFPSLLEDICRSLEPHRLTYYLADLASLFHRYFNLGNKYPEHRVITEDRDATLARLYLALGVKTVLAVGLDLLGIHAPEKM